jgi:hypothetical protein
MLTSKTVIRGKDLVYSISDDGKFSTDWNGESYQHLTLKGLKEQIERQMKKKPMSVRCFMVERQYYDENLQVQRVTVTGRHSGNNNLLVRDSDGTAAQMRQNHNLLDAKTDLRKLKALHETARKAQKAYEEFRDASRAEIPEEV